MKVMLVLASLFLFFACSEKSKKIETVDPELIAFDSLTVSQQLERMVKKDQDIQFAHGPNDTQTVRDSLFKEKDRIFFANTDTIKKLFNDYGYLGVDDVGAAGAYNFWILAQHADHDISFQEEVLSSMLPEVKNKTADGTNYAYLSDRVLKNKGLKQIYGTQVKYTHDLWAVPQALQDSLNVNQRRLEVGLLPIEHYLNEVMDIHFQLNPSFYEEKGLKGPRAYDVSGARL